MLKLTIKILITTVLLVALSYYSDIASIRLAFGRVEWTYVIAATFVIIALTPLLAFRWVYIANAIDITLSIKPAILIVLIGTFFNQVLPSAIGGDAIRIWLLKKENISLTKCLSSILLDRVIALFSMMIIVIAGFAVLKEILHSGVIQSTVAIIVGSGMAGVITLLFFDKIPLPLRFATQSYVSKLLTLATDARAVFFNPRPLLKTILLSVLIHLMVSISVWLIALGIGVTINLEIFILLLPFVLLLSLLPISIAGWGVREGAMVVCLGYAGVDSASALVISVLFGVAYIFAGIPGGIVWLIEEKLKKNNNRR